MAAAASSMDIRLNELTWSAMTPSLLSWIWKLNQQLMSLIPEPNEFRCARRHRADPGTRIGDFSLKGMQADTPKAGQWRYLQDRGKVFRVVHKGDRSRSGPDFSLSVAQPP
ncbi:hypothetical protein GCM10011315_35030 [Roseovarius pacificus]|nr:hypothetical protein GCM10011315_35030 [Roseovarius pacificus]